MIKLQRGPAPQFWSRKRIKEWTKKWIAKECDGRRWQWPQYRQKRINEYARKTMERWHHNKCAFCETPLFSGTQIEHFRSKVKYPLAAFIWRNLFLICQNCNQRKGERDHTGCLKPDRDDPVAYLWVNPILLKVEPRLGLSDEMRQCAEKTIALYGLDRPELKKLYEEYLKMVQRTPVVELAQEDRPFTLMIRSLLDYRRIDENKELFV
jgi:uncharacterized protein (TIGR02646 family)